MSLGLSRFLIILQALLLLLPVTLMSSFFGLTIIVVFWESGEELAMVFLTAMALLALYSGWIIAAIFVLKDFAVFKRTGVILLPVASYGVLITALAWLSFFINPEARLTLFVYATPALLPFLHLTLEWRFRTPPN